MNYREWLSDAAASRRERLVALADAEYKAREQIAMNWALFEIVCLPETTDCPAEELIPEEAL